MSLVYRARPTPPPPPPLPGASLVDINSLENDCYVYSIHVDLCELLTIAVQAVLVDSGFIVQPLKAHETVTKLLQWCGNPAHHPALCSFSSELARELYACLHVDTIYGLAITVHMCESGPTVKTRAV